MTKILPASTLLVALSASAFVMVVRATVIETPRNDVQAAGRPAGPTVYSCSYEVNAKGTSGEASVELQDGAIEKLSVFSFYAGLPGKLGYSCTLEVGRKDTGTKWAVRASQFCRYH